MNQATQQIAVVTGAAGGIGAACALRLAKDGCDVVIADLKSAAAVADSIEALGRRCIAARCDVTDSADIESLRTTVAACFGRCDVLVNCTGIYTTVPFDDLTYEQWRRYFSVNLDSAFLMAKAFVPFMRKRRFGRIIAIASNSYYANVPGLTAYVATKGALVGLMRGLASDFGPDGITANVVAPGPILTEQLKSTLTGPDGVPSEDAMRGFFGMIEQTQAVKRTGVPADVADVVSFLAGSGSSFVTGQTVVVDGGFVRL